MIAVNWYAPLNKMSLSQAQIRQNTPKWYLEELEKEKKANHEYNKKYLESLKKN